MKPEQSLSSSKKTLEISRFGMLALAVLAGFGGGLLANNTKVQQASNTQVQREVINSEGDLISQISKNMGDSVVSINVTGTATQNSVFFGTQSFEQESAGTGLILTKEGVVITNRHVVPNANDKVSITLSDGTELDQVEVLGRTNATDPLDVAFLKIKDAKGKELKPAALGKSADVKVGDRVVAIGNALGQFQNTVTSGIISGFGRSIQAGDSSGSAQTETLLNLFQTDASINQGNSGGPLVNLKGEVIGINTAVAGGGAENIGFAIPIDDIQPLIKTVLDKGKLERPYLGVRYASITADLAYTYNLPVQEGAYIIPSRNSASIVSGSPAEKAGLQEKDIITKIAGEAITPKRSLVSILGSKSVGDKVDLTILRDGKEQTITVTLEAAPSN
ncbi:trypsin-like peptidase domain-containing protein [Candidatus Saccharibacteria bacterium]|jgi:serine protease Do|nr:MAG: trypsin-like peptidase domain-containing protein [Candidatus Saccharibacteria bacterium]